MTKETYSTLLKAISLWGADAQLKMLLEEMSELQKEICKFWRGKDNLEAIADEIADVEIMIAQTKIIFGVETKVDDHKDMKLKRLAQRIAKAEASEE